MPSYAANRDNFQRKSQIPLVKDFMASRMKGAGNLGILGPAASNLKRVMANQINDPTLLQSGSAGRNERNGARRRSLNQELSETAGERQADRDQSSNTFFCLTPGRWNRPVREGLGECRPKE